MGFSGCTNVNKEIIQANIRRISKPLEIQYFQGFFILQSLFGIVLIAVKLYR